MKHEGHEKKLKARKDANAKAKTLDSSLRWNDGVRVIPPNKVFLIPDCPGSVVIEILHFVQNDKHICIVIINGEGIK